MSLAALDSRRPNIQVNEHTTLFTKPDEINQTTVQRIATLGIALLMVGVLVAAIESRDDGYAAVPLIIMGGALFWIALRLNTNLTQREVLRVAATLFLYPGFVAALQWINNEEGSRWSLAGMSVVYAVYGIALAGFIDRSLVRTVERIKNPPSANVTKGESKYECLPHHTTYNPYQLIKGTSGAAIFGFSWLIPSPYRLLSIMGGGFLMGTSAGELGLNIFANKLDKSLESSQFVSTEEGIGEIATYSTRQRVGVGVVEVAGNFGLFAGTLGSGLALHFEQYYWLTAITILVGMHQVYTKRELFRQRHTELSLQENGRPVRRFLLGWGIVLAGLMGGGITAYGIYKAVKSHDKAYEGAAGGMISSWGISFLTTFLVARIWKKESGVILSMLEEFAVSNPVILAFLTVYVNHVAVNKKLNLIGSDVLGILGLIIAAALLGSDNGRALNRRVTHGIPRISPAAAVALAHFFILFMTLFSVPNKGVQA